MSRPYELYIRYLFTTGIENRLQANDKLEELGLPPISLDEYTEVGAYVLDAIPRGIAKQLETGKYGPDFSPWMDLLDVSELWYGSEKDLKAVYDIHTDKQYRLSLNTLLIKHIPIGDIQQMLNIKFSAAFSVKQLEIYRKFFFDPSRMRRADWLNFVDSCGPHEKHIYFTALTRDVEAVKAELDLNATIPVSEELAKLLRKALNKANQYMRVSGKEGNVEARYWIDTVLKLTDKYEKYRATDSADFSKSLQMEFEYIDNEFPLPDEETLASLNAKLKAKEEQKTEEDEEG